MLSLVFGTAALAEQDATLTLQMSYSTGAAGSTATPIGGVTATAYCVAELDETSGSYALVDGFSSLDVDLNSEIDASSMEAAAKQAAEMAATARAKGVSATSDAQGVASFGSLPYGVYLVVQTGSEGDAEKYKELEPFLINVPQFAEDGVVYNVVANPKTTPLPTPKPPTPKPPTPVKPPVTGDTTNLQPLWMYAAVGGAMTIAGIWGLGRARRKDAANA